MSELQEGEEPGSLALDGKSIHGETFHPMSSWSFTNVGLEKKCHDLTWLTAKAREWFRGAYSQYKIDALDENDPRQPGRVVTQLVLLGTSFDKPDTSYFSK